MCDCEHTSSNELHPAQQMVNGADIPLPDVPVAGAISIEQEGAGDTGVVVNPNRPIVTGIPNPRDPGIPHFPPLTPCNLDFRDGCYSVTLQPNLVPFGKQVGTLRIDRGAPASGPDGVIVSGDLYSTPPPVIQPVPSVPLVPADEATDEPGVQDTGGSVAASASRVVRSPILRFPRIPIFPRSRYRAYLKGTRLTVPAFTFGSAPCQVTIEMERFNYTQPPAGQFKGTFPSSASSTLKFVVTQVPGPPFPLFGGPRFTGRYFVNGVDKGSVSLTWVSSFLRRAVLEIDTLKGAVPPQPVPALSGSGTEFFDTVYAKARWQLTIDTANDQVDIPVPAGVNPTDCWSAANLHNLMTSVRKPGTDLDAEWRTHLVVVPAKLGCSRGVMYDQIGVPREGSASFSDDGYPTSDSSNFGAAANGKQRDFPRAFLRSATHEVTHAFNQIHQEQETSADNSIMTTTPSVADVLGGPATGAPGVFPDQINLGFNTTVRNHLAHMPDPVVRPGGWPFASWFPSGAPQANDKNLFRDDELRFEVSTDTDRAALGAPVTVTWRLTNESGGDLLVPNDLRLEGLFASMSSMDESGEERPVRPFVITCESTKLAPLAAGDSLEASYKVFWSSDGFPLERPGRHTITVTVSWSAGGVPVAVTGRTDLWVDRPVTEAENRDAALVMHDDVGKWVVLGGRAYHLEEAVNRLRALDSGGSDAADGAGGERSRVADSFAGLMPESQDTGDGGKGRTGRRGSRSRKKG
jgi:hypothetical protein